MTLQSFSCWQQASYFTLNLGVYLLLAGYEYPVFIGLTIPHGQSSGHSHSWQKPQWSYSENQSSCRIVQIHTTRNYMYVNMWWRAQGEEGEGRQWSHLLPKQHVEKILWGVPRCLHKKEGRTGKHWYCIEILSWIKQRSWTKGEKINK